MGSRIELGQPARGPRLHRRSAGRGLLAEAVRVCRARATSWPSATWTRAIGQPTSPGGARYGYTLLSVILISNLMAILLQALAVRLGIASGRDLAQACRDSYSWPVTIGCGFSARSRLRPAIWPK